MRLEDMSIDQLIDLNEAICQRIDELRERQAMQTLQQLRLGQTVSFNSSKSGPVFGTLIKVNRKTVIVASDEGRQWKVPVNMIQPVRDVE